MDRSWLKQLKIIGNEIRANYFGLISKEGLEHLLNIENNKG